VCRRVPTPGGGGTGSSSSPRYQAPESEFEPVQRARQNPLPPPLRMQTDRPAYAPMAALADGAVVGSGRAQARSKGKRGIGGRHERALCARAASAQQTSLDGHLFAADELPEDFRDENAHGTRCAACALPTLSASPARTSLREALPTPVHRPPHGRDRGSRPRPCRHAVVVRLPPSAHRPPAGPVLSSSHTWFVDYETVCFFFTCRNRELREDLSVTPGSPGAWKVAASGTVW